ncbi:hypothetical protein H8356DRAFT_1669871 [Neocallimastix lanati (nom. inval.)]|nr:hypothetical protein H8356DRAFT_1669871 [Neocallimastix sp. JGI-2020a]
MLQINEENVLKDLTIIRSKLNTASLEECVETLQLLVKSIFFLKEKKLSTYQDKEWNDYCKIRYNLGKHFVEIIRLYNERLSVLINEQYDLLENNESSRNKQKYPAEDNSFMTDSIRSSSIRSSTNLQSQKELLAQNYGTPNSISDYNQSSGSGSNINSNNLNINSYNQSGDESYNVYYYPPSPNPVNHNQSYHSNNKVYPNNGINNNVNRRNTVGGSNVTSNGTVSSPSNSYIEFQVNNDGASGIDITHSINKGSNNSMSVASQSVITSSYSYQQEDDDNEELIDELDSIIGKYLCTKEFKANEDFQIDLQLNDLVTINQFSGKYILGKNCRSKAEGLFPIYYIDSIDGNYVFFRCKEDMEFASVNDEIFLLREADNDYYPGYNITKGEQGIFNLSKLEPIVMDDNKRNEIEGLYEVKNKDNESKSSLRQQSTTNSQMSVFSNDNNFDDTSLVGPLLPTSNNEQPISMQNNTEDYVDIFPGDLNSDKINNIDQGIVEKLLEYYKSIPNIQESNKDKVSSKKKTSTDNNLDLMQNAIKKFKEFRADDGKGDMSKEDSFISPSIFENIETKKRKWEANRYRCQELVETEKSYCDKMRIMIDKFMKPLEDAVETENEMLNRIQISLIFKNIPDIYEFSYKLHKELEVAFSQYDNEGPIPIATVFLNKFSDWKIYIKYVEDFHSASATLENLKKSPQTDRFNRFMEQCQKSEECNKSHLKDLIVLPIQRFLKYRLLFEGIKKDSDPRNQESYRLLDTVENYIFEIGEIMNNAKRIQENINKMFSLEKTIMNYPPELISYTQRSFIAEWPIHEIKAKRLYLFSDTVLFANYLNRKSKKGKKYQYIYEKRIDILDYDIIKNTSTSKKVIKFKETDRLRNSKTYSKSNRSFSSHSHSLLGFSLGSHSTGYSVPITKSLIFFETEENCNDFYNKYNEQKEILLRKQ